MKILLAVSMSDERFHVIPDLGLGYLASLARGAGHEVRFVDCLFEHYHGPDWERVIREYEPDLVGIKAYSVDLESVEEMLKIAKGISPEITTVIGGPHPSTEKAEGVFEQFPDLDYAFAGEGEPGWLPFLEQLEANHHEFSGIPGVVWKESDGTVCHNDRTFVEDLDSVPFPDWELIKPQQYRFGFSFMTSKYPAAPMMATRGCPYLCTFCGSYLITGRKVRRRSMDNIVEEIRFLQKDFGIRSIDFLDENFVFYRPFVMEFCERLLSENIKIGWNCPHGVRLDRIDEEMVVLMERAGCFGVSCGIESGSDRILKMIRKVLTVEEIREKVTMIKRVTKMKIQGFFMMGFPEETKEEIEATIDLAVSLPLDIAIFSPLRPTPGTEIYENLVSAGMLFSEVNYAPDEMGQHYFVRSYSPVSDADMKKLYRKAYLKFYGRPKVILSLLGQVRSVSQMRTIANGAYRLIQRPITKLDPRRREQHQETV